MKFTLQFFAAVVILFFGVLLGMQQANEGLLKMKGYHDPSFQSVVAVKKNEKGAVEATVLGNKVTSETVDEKAKKLEQWKMFNLFSELGKRLAEAVHLAVTELLSLFGKLVK
ncbi:YqxA family protein [Anoxybacillus sp. J5B_2022]|uniref:YqxA family protein n=1 Tax=Anoxybacillus sp. J5B_2022 TaxID=3003246 RepID=UPI002285F958|nr:YqxA family protein [Anoxybacillus sp. J5B_2022]MCZ0755545.1 YqxA family protein [Anoxybacillus sp. J5B_2022]